MLQSKDIEWLNGFKKIRPIYASSKRLTSDLKIHTKVRGLKKVFYTNTNGRKPSKQCYFQTKQTLNDCNGL